MSKTPISRVLDIFFIMKFFSSHIIFIIAITIAACSGPVTEKQRDTKNSESDPLLISNKYAEGFATTRFPDYTLVEVKNPWQGANNVLFRYILYETKEVPNHSYINASEIKVPVQRIVCMSTTHIGFMDKLNELNKIVGIANSDLISNEFLVESTKNGTVADVGYEQNINFELLLKISPDLIMTYSIGSEITSLKNKLNELDIDISVNAEYLESHPLGKAEWIKFVALFFNKLSLANEIFDRIEFEYQNLIILTADIKPKPTVLAGLPWKGTWYIPGGNSYASRLIDNAGGIYLWSSNESHEAIGLNIEAVYETARDADIWINTGSAKSIKDIREVDERLTFFSALQKGKVYNNNAQENNNGGNNYWEHGLVDPQTILADLIRIFHPEILSDSLLTYYKQIE